MFAGCKREQPQQETTKKINVSEIERCERGIERAVLQTDTRQAMKTYYGECAGIYSEEGCRKAYQAAADAEPAEQMTKVIEGCRAAYCPSFANQELEACKPDFKATGGANALKAWPPLHEAILERDARGYAPRVSRAMLVFYSRVMQRMGGAAVPAGSAGAEAAPAADGSAPMAADAAGSAEPTGADAAIAKTADAGKSTAGAQARKGAGATPSP